MTREAVSVPSDKCRKCGQSHYDCLCNGDNHIPREARTRLPPPLAGRYVAIAVLVWRWLRIESWMQGRSLVIYRPKWFGLIGANTP